MKHVFIILCLSCVIKLGVAFKAEEVRVNEQRSKQDSADDLEGSETTAKLFNLGSLFPTYSSYPSYRPNNGYYPSSSGGSYYPTYNPTQGYYPSSSYYPTGTGTNVLGTGYGNYPTQSYYPGSGYVRTGGYGGYSGYGGYGGYGGNGGLKSYYGYDSPLYSGKRNLGFGYYSDTDRYGFYRSPSQQYSVNRGYN